MAMEFAMKGYNGKTVCGSYATGELKISGNFHMHGPQPINNNGGAPEWVANMFDVNPDLKQIALSSEGHSVVWSKIKPGL